MPSFTFPAVLAVLMHEYAQAIIVHRLTASRTYVLLSPSFHHMPPQPQNTAHSASEYGKDAA
ncbi:hypothetical protein [Bifidobacterium boum]|uniref:hypothetical protein n=1 Tax=Bifidobacterium boum TaxID=78343 RepID=UPI00047CF071